MGTARPVRVALVWAQFIPAHVDRIHAVHARLAGQAQVSAIEVASTSTVYGDFSPTAPLNGIDHHLLFPGRSFDQVGGTAMLCALLRKLCRADLVCIGIPYSVPAMLVLTALLRMCGTRVVLVYDSKFDDKPRRAWFEWFKSCGLELFSGAIVASARSRDYLRFLGFRRRPVLGGTDGIAVERIRRDAEAGGALPKPAFSARDFVYVGRFAPEKNLDTVLQAFARHVADNPGCRRCLTLVGSGPLDPGLKARAAALGVADRVRFKGFVEGAELAATIARSLALVLASTSEPWGLVVNEAVALGVPVIASEAPGARDVLVRNLVNGFVVPAGSVESLARAMTQMGRDEAAWQAMAEASRQRAWLGDADRFADAVELLVDPAAQPAGESMARYFAAFDDPCVPDGFRSQR